MENMKITKMNSLFSIFCISFRSVMAENLGFVINYTWKIATKPSKNRFSMTVIEVYSLHTVKRST